MAEAKHYLVKIIPLQSIESFITSSSLKIELKDMG